MPELPAPLPLPVMAAPVGLDLLPAQRVVEDLETKVAVLKAEVLKQSLKVRAAHAVICCLRVHRMFVS